MSEGGAREDGLGRLCLGDVLGRGNSNAQAPVGGLVVRYGVGGGSAVVLSVLAETVDQIF